MQETAAVQQPIGESAAVQNLLTVLRNNGAEREMLDVESLVKHIENMEEQFGKVLSQLDIVQSQLKMIQDKGAVATIKRVYDTASHKVGEVKTQFAAMKQSVISAFSDAAQAVQQKGVSALRKTVDFFKIRSALTGLKNKLNGAVQSLNNGAERVQGVKTELETARQHRKNAVRMLFGKQDTSSYRHCPDSGVLSSIQKMMQRLGQMMTGMSKATDTAIGKLDALERKDERLSVRGELKAIKLKRSEAPTAAPITKPDKAR